jgi:hypothetical protein
MPQDECGFDDGLVFEKKPKDWVALFHIPLVHTAQTSTINDTQCTGVIDRVSIALSLDNKLTSLILS